MRRQRSDFGFRELMGTKHDLKYNDVMIVYLTVGPWADVKNGFTWKIIIVLKVRGGHGE